MGVDVGGETYGSTRYLSTSVRVRVWFTGLSMWNSSTASSPLPISAMAITAHRAAWVY
jgi:hypothetical protein